MAIYQCRFRGEEEKRPAHDVSVDIVLTNTHDFAEFIQWDDLLIIPIELVHDEASDKTGYGVFQYLDTS